MRTKDDVLVILKYNIDYLRDCEIDDRQNVITTLQYVVDNLDDVVDMIEEYLTTRGIND